MDDMHALLVEEIKDLYSAENMLVKALPRMAQGAQTPELRQAFKHHLRETEGHVQRLEQVAQRLEAKPRGKKCIGMEGLVQEGKEVLGHNGDPDVRDAGLIGAAQKVEHYEMAAYGAARSHAQQLGYDDVARTLQQTLDEEGEANKKLTDLALSSVNRRAAIPGSNGVSQD